jgi:hypothetical protein
MTDLFLQQILQRQERVRARMRAQAAVRQAARAVHEAEVLIPLLLDIRDVFGTQTRLATRDLIKGLLRFPARRRNWKKANRGGPIDAYWLREHLRYELDPPGSGGWLVKTRRGWTTQRGYCRHQFTVAFKHYLTQLESVVDSDPPSSREISGRYGIETEVS